MLNHMVKHSEAQLDLVLHALADPTRRALLRRLAREELSVSELAEPFSMSLAAVSKHLKVLESARIVDKTKQGRVYRCRANLEPLAQVSALLEDLGAFWQAQLNSLNSLLSPADQSTKIKPRARIKRSTGK
jgi:DNA-binding transcriptional ArsR family regulator